MRGWLLGILLTGCVSELADRDGFYCEHHGECRPGWSCTANRCAPGAPPLDLAPLDDASPVDMRPAPDLAPPTPDMYPALDQAIPVDGAPPPPDLALPPVDQGPPPPIDQWPIDQALPVDGGPLDGDGDGVPDADDNCPFDANANQADLDRDGRGDACDGDRDGDGADDETERACGSDPGDAASVPADRDRDGICDALEDDRDHDGVENAIDNCPDLYNPPQRDLNGDGVGDRCACPNEGAPCGVTLGSYCERNLACDTDFVIETANGRCIAGRCEIEEVEPDRVDRCFGSRCVNDDDGTARCLPAMECLGADGGDDTDRDGIPDGDDVCPRRYDPTQTDADGIPGGDACALDCGDDRDCDRLLGAWRCEAPRPICGDAVVITLGPPVCVGGQCALGERQEVCDAGEICAAQAGELVCQPSNLCEIEPDPDCAANNDGFLCILEDPLELGRCVSGACRSWRCTTLDCNENGPRYFSAAPLALGPIEAGFEDTNTGLEWRPAGLAEAGVPPLDLVAAHAFCAAEEGGLAWRLPSVWELMTLRPVDAADRAALEAVLGPIPARIQARTVGRVEVGQPPRLVVDLLGGGVVLDVAPAETLCVRETDVVVRDKTARARAVLEGGDEFLDPWTGRRWVVRPDARRLMHGDALDDCADRPGARLPTVRELVSVMVWKGAAPPGLLLGWDGAAYPPLAGPLWSVEAGPDGGIWTQTPLGPVIANPPAEAFGFGCVDVSPDDR